MLGIHLLSSLSSLSLSPPLCCSPVGNTTKLASYKSFPCLATMSPEERQRSASSLLFHPPSMKFKQPHCCLLPRTSLSMHHAAVTGDAIMRPLVELITPPAPIAISLTPSKSSQRHTSSPVTLLPSTVVIALCPLTTPYPDPASSTSSKHPLASSGASYRCSVVQKRT